MEGAVAVAEECRTYASNTGFTSNAIKCDVSNEAEVSNMVETAVKDYGRVDFFVHSAGVCRPKPLPLPLRGFDRPANILSDFPG